MIAMRTVLEGRIAGEFHGYAAGRIYELSDVSRWRQEDRADEPVYRERPRAKLLRDDGSGAFYLDVEGTSGIVRVVPNGSMSGSSVGAF